MEGALVNAYKLRSASNVGIVVVSWQLLYQKNDEKTRWLKRWKK